MLLWLLNHLDPTWLGSGAALQKITLRGSLSAILAFAVVLTLGPCVIRWLGRHCREPNKSDSAHLRKLHRKKNATPTMGGGLVIAGLSAALLAFGDLQNPYLQTALVVIAGLTTLGMIDDLAKLRGPKSGISPRAKLIGQIAVAATAALLLYPRLATAPGGLDLQLPLSGIGIPLGIWFLPLTVLVIVGSSNAVNLTDGLDGLAAGCLIFSTAAMAVVAYLAGHAGLAEYLQLTRIPGSGEMAVLAGGMIGSVMGFLWFNCHPARVFMGDTGSLPLGGLLGLIAVVARQEILLFLIAGVFVVEAASVILQIGYYKWRRRRIFLCAPLHHHFQFRGWPENRIVVRFWIASALCALLGLATLKFAIRDSQPGRQPPLSQPAAGSLAAPNIVAVQRDNRSAHDLDDDWSRLP
jgi:phospho-N-acetylmuramoyl-pentapeptide-transferase